MAGTPSEHAASGNEKRNGSIDGGSKKAGEENRKTESAGRTGGPIFPETGKGAGTEPGKSAGTEPGNREVKPARNTVNPTEIAPDEFARDEHGNIILKADGTPARKRGRKKGATSSGARKSASKTAPRENGVGVEMLAQQFQVLNTCLAYLTRFDDFKLDDGEAIEMAKASANVMEQFDYTPDPKISAVLGLLTVTSSIYGPRVYFYRKHLREVAANRAEKRKAQFDEAAARGEFDLPNNMGQFSG